VSDAAPTSADELVGPMAPGQSSGSDAAPKKQEPLLPDLGGFELQLAKHEYPEQSLGLVKVTPQLSGKLQFKPAGDKKGAKGGDAHPTENKVAVSSKSVKLKAEQELGSMPVTDMPVKLGREVELSTKGPKVSVGVSTDFKRKFGFDGLKFGPTEVGIEVFEWQPGKKPSLLFMKVKLPAKAGPVAFEGYEATLSAEAVLKVEPDWTELAKRYATSATAAAVAEAALALSPFVVFIGGMIAWAKSGHEFDDFERRAQIARGAAKAAANLAVGKAFDADLRGPNELFGAASELGTISNSAVPQMLEKLGVPAGAAAAKFAQDPSFRDALYRQTWAVAWPQLRQAGLDHFKDGLFTSYKHERMVIESYGTGPYAQGF
jgi:hypothetical protein